MPTKTTNKPVRARTRRKPAAKALSVPTRKKVVRAVGKAAAAGVAIKAVKAGAHIGRYAILAGIAAAAAASAFALMPDSVSGEVKKQVKAKGKAARASVSDAEHIMKQAIDAARSYASKALH